jgi:hypothetical protein
MAATIFGEIKKGDWTTQTSFFPTVEHTGEVSSYGDYSENGSAGANTNWPQRQSYLFQTIVEYGELELDRAGLAKIGWVSEQNGAAALALNKYSNLTYFFGVQGLQNYGLLNDPNLTASLTPAPKAAGGNAWVVNGVIVATANNDILSLFLQLTSQTVGLIDKKSPMKLSTSPSWFSAESRFGPGHVFAHSPIRVAEPQKREAFPRRIRIRRLEWDRAKHLLHGALGGDAIRVQSL